MEFEELNLDAWLGTSANDDPCSCSVRPRRLRSLELKDSVVSVEDPCESGDNSGSIDTGRGKAALQRHQASRHRGMSLDDDRWDLRAWHTDLGYTRGRPTACEHARRNRCQSGKKGSGSLQLTCCVAARVQSDRAASSHRPWSSMN